MERKGPTACRRPDCRRYALHYGLCVFCYSERRQKKAAREARAELRAAMSAEDVFATKVQTFDDGCWLWTGTQTTAGYGRFRIPGGSTVAAHRFSYETAYGPIPSGLVIDHLCRTHSCVRPDHLRAVPQGVNIRDGLLGFGLTGMCRALLHDVTDDADIIYLKNGTRVCRGCKQDRDREYRARKRAGRKA